MTPRCALWGRLDQSHGVPPLLAAAQLSAARNVTSDWSCVTAEICRQILAVVKPRDCTLLQIARDQVSPQQSDKAQRLRPVF